nr:acyltransferase [uncultured Flavobacterium sp.]
MKRILKKIYLWFYTYLLSKIEGQNNFDSLIVKVRYFYLRPMFKKMGSCVNIQPYVWIEGFHNISIGNNSGIGRGSHICAMDIVEIGENVMIAEQLIIITVNHQISMTKNMINLPMIKKPVKIGDNVWLGARVTILPGVTIGDNVVIAAGSIVTRDCSSNGIYGGIPAKFIKEIVD